MTHSDENDQIYSNFFALVSDDSISQSGEPTVRPEPTSTVGSSAPAVSLKPTVKLHEISDDDRPSKLSLDEDTSHGIDAIQAVTSQVLTKSQKIERDIRKQFYTNRRLSSLANPLSSLAYCTNPKLHAQANYLVDAVTPEGYMARIEFRLRRSRSINFYNPNLLPYPKGSKYPYLAIVRMSPRVAGLFHHELAYCDVRWTRTRTIHRRVLECANGGLPVKFEADWKSLDGACKSHSFLQLHQGHTDPRVFFSPHGEPLMIVGTNGKSKHNCMGQFIIDLRMLIPNLATKMNIKHLPIRFPNLVPLPRPDMREIEKNWFIMYDTLDSDKEYLHYSFDDRALASLDPPQDGRPYKLIGNPSPKIISGLLQTFKKNDWAANDLHQSSNSLLVTLCDFPCIPTIHNTVLIEVLHLKYLNYFELYYRRFVVVMNATAPFDVLGRTENLMYAGTDTNAMIYTVSIVWDKELYPTHEPWDDDVYGGQKIWAEMEEIEQFRLRKVNTAKIEQVDEEKPNVKEDKPNPYSTLTLDLRSASNARATSVTPSRTSSKLTASTTTRSTSIRTSTMPKPKPKPKSKPKSSSTTVQVQRPSPLPRITKPQQNPFVSDKYHGWLDDILMINFGIQDAEGAVLHVQARELLECIKIS
ncbi:uncharacterized protein V1516DRAFT_628874 [Lipomyces oligophaga]|uniref:uncharacterized protein n=1 Tax=Lipomyces oligophaga TaxID=45792 RepID=UPI0034CDA9E7